MKPANSFPINLIQINHTSQASATPPVDNAENMAGWNQYFDAGEGVGAVKLEIT
jgi:hypothetical protein